MVTNAKSTMSRATTLCALAASVALAGCGSVRPAEEARADIYDDRDHLEQQLLQGSTLNSRPSAVKTVDGIYYAGKPFKLSERQFLPAIFDQQFIFSQMQPITLQELLSLVSAEIGYRVTLTSDALDFMKGTRSRGSAATGSGAIAGGADITDFNADEGPVEASIFDQVDEAGSGVSATNIKFSFRHEGSLSALFDRVTSKADLFWEFRDNQIFVFRTISKTLVLDVLPTETSLKSTVTTNRRTADDAGGRSQSGQDVESAYDSGEVYDQIEEALTSMLSQNGAIRINRSLGSVTVRDTPRVIGEIESYVSDMNRIANRNIGMRIQVYEVSIEKTSDFAADLDVLFSGSDRISASLDGSFTSGLPVNIAAGVVNPESRFANSVAQLRSEGRDVDLSTLTDHFTITKNGQPAPIQLVNEKDYLESVERSTDGQGNQSVSLTPGKALEGITINALPRILSDNSVDLVMTVDMSNVNGIDQITVGAGDNESAIQLTDIDSRTISRTLNIKNGQGIMIAGLARTERESQQAGIFGSNLWFAGGRKGGGERQIISVVMVTPYVMER